MQHVDPIKRKLSEVEREQIRVECLIAEQRKHPGAAVEVYVREETDEQGKPIVRVIWQDTE